VAVHLVVVAPADIALDEAQRVPHLR
jgi:hypothetical protein